MLVQSIEKLGKLQSTNWSLSLNVETNLKWVCPLCPFQTTPKQGDFEKTQPPTARSKILNNSAGLKERELSTIVDPWCHRRSLLKIDVANEQLPRGQIGSPHPPHEPPTPLSGHLHVLPKLADCQIVSELLCRNSLRDQRCRLVHIPWPSLPLEAPAVKLKGFLCLPAPIATLPRSFTSPYKESYKAPPRHVQCFLKGKTKRSLPRRKSSREPDGGGVGGQPQPATSCTPGSGPTETDEFGWPRHTRKAFGVSGKRLASADQVQFLSLWPKTSSRVVTQIYRATDRQAGRQTD